MPIQYAAHLQSGPAKAKGAAVTDPATIAAPAPLLLDAAGAAALCSVSRATWFSMQAAGQIPAAVLRRGRVVRWSYAEIVAWIAAGCPARDRWAIISGRPRL